MQGIWAARALTPRGVERDVRLELEAGRIARIECGVAAHAGDATHPDATLVPGLIDLQVNGGDGCGYDDPDPAARRRATEFHVRAGTTGLVPALISAPLDALEAALRRLADDVSREPELLGIHLEGPFLAPAKSGAHTGSHLLEPTPERVRRLIAAAGPALRIATLAPEVDGALEAIACFRRAGALVAAGHTRASLAQVRAAIDAGLSWVTHAGNATDWPTRGFDARAGYRASEPGVVGAFMVDARLRAGLILDGHHLHPELARALIELRGRDAVALVSDAAPFAGLPPGDYEMWGMRASVDARGFATCGEGLAGSTATLADIVRCAVGEAGIALEDAIHMASAVPADALGLGERKGRLREGFDADLLVLDGSLRPAWVCVAGRAVAEHLQSERGAADSLG